MNDYTWLTHAWFENLLNIKHELRINDTYTLHNGKLLSIAGSSSLEYYVVEWLLLAIPLYSPNHEPGIRIQWNTKSLHLTKHDIQYMCQNSNILSIDIYSDKIHKCIRTDSNTYNFDISNVTKLDIIFKLEHDFIKGG